MMGMEADIIVIGPKKLLLEVGVQDYCEQWYKVVPDDVLILGTLGPACTSDQSRRLAKLVGVDPWALGDHRIRNVKDAASGEIIGTEDETDIRRKVWSLLCGGAQLWFRPNG